MRTMILRSLIATAVAAAMLLGPARPAAAHTDIPIAGLQFVGAGYVSLFGVASQQVSDGPTTDGTVTFVNLDPITHQVLVYGPQSFEVMLEPGESAELSNLPPGKYDLTDESYSFMRGVFHVAE